MKSGSSSSSDKRSDHSSDTSGSQGSSLRLVVSNERRHPENDFNNHELVKRKIGKASTAADTNKYHSPNKKSTNCSIF